MSNPYLSRMMQAAKGKKYSMPLAKAIEEHRRLTGVLRSNSRPAELKELKDQAEELEDMRRKAAGH